MTEPQYTGVGARRSHRKSRLGCSSCKRRRVKCDETKPRCKNCTKHDLACDYAPNAANPKTPQPLLDVVSTPLDGPHEEFDLLTAELMHQWCTSTAVLFSTDTALENFMRSDAPRIACANNHALHMILAISALHLGRLRPDREAFYINRAETHYQAGLQKAIPLLPTLNEETCHSMLLFASLCSGYSMARGPRHGQYLLFSDTGPAEWNVVFKGILPILGLHYDAIMKGPVAPLVSPGALAAASPPGRLSSTDQEALSRLQRFVSSTSASADESRTLEAALRHLQHLFASCSPGSLHNVPQFQHFGVWMYQSTNGLSALLQANHPGALVIFAYAATILHKIKGWATEGWAQHILSAVYERLPTHCHEWVAWPMDQVGWTP